MAKEHPENPRTSIRPGFAWEDCAAYLFDVDGTLLRSRDRVHFNAFAAGVERATGRKIQLDGVPLAGNTDTAILAAAWRQAGLDEAELARQSEAIRQAMADWVAEHRAELEPELLPGVEAMLAHLAARNALLGVATGNLEKIGWIKLERAGLRKWFRMGGFSDGFLVRAEMVAAAAAQARALRGDPAATVCVVGDTPRDIEAARFAGLPVISVATGHYGFDELAALDPDVCTTTLADLLASGEPR